MNATLYPSELNPHVPLWKLEIDDTTMAKLVELSQFHCKLALEHIQS